MTYNRNLLAGLITKRLAGTTALLLAGITVLHLCVTPAQALTITADNERSYAGEFTDLSESAWYYDDVVTAYSLGLLNGKTGTTFAPDQSLSIAEAIKLAAVCHQILTVGYTDESAFASAGSTWYEGYVTYCYHAGIVTEDYEDYSAAASRAQVAVLFSRAMLQSGSDIAELNEAAFGDLPDVDTTAWYAGAVYRMYRWGILTGDSSNNIRPENSIKRSEIATILMRMIDADKRVDLDAAADTSTADTPSETPNTTDKTEDKTPEETTDSSAAVTPTLDALTLYSGSRDNKSFTGITGFAGEFSITDSVPTTGAAYSLDLVNTLVLEPDNISFRLYTGAGFEALGIVRGWLNEAARGKDGATIREKSDVFEKINELCYVWLNGERAVISEMWYADHGEYTTYAFYFEKDVDPGKVTSAQIMCGRLDTETLTGASMAALAEQIEQADKEGVITADPATPDSDNYNAAIADAKDTAAEILFEYECERCKILYGRGLYGRESDEYRLLFIFRDGTTQTIASQKIEDVRMNAAGNVLYYNLTGPDGKVISYGINFGE